MHVRIAFVCVYISIYDMYTVHYDVLMFQPNTSIDLMIYAM